MILMENTDWSSVKNSASAPYINRTLLPIGSHAERYYNPPNLHPSLPNYLWLEAGTNFGILDGNPPAQNHQSTSSHLVNLLEAAGISWKAYQEDEGAGAFDGTACPFTHEGNFYDVNHNPFVYFDDVTGNMNPSAPRCLQHVRPYSEFLTDLGNNTVARYNFITPHLCHDMHNTCAPLNDRVLQGDRWLSTEVPKILASQAYRNNGVLFITWDEGASSAGCCGNASGGQVASLVIAPNSIVGLRSITNETHYSLLRTIEDAWGLAPLGQAANAVAMREYFH